MKLHIAENIRAFRKERKMTQEQLAEAVGVTVGAVSKWESGASTPDIALIAEIANFFETSVDALLGFEMLNDNAKQAAERISTLRNEKKFDAAAAEAEKALQKYPNNFLVTMRSAILYCMKGMERAEQKTLRRALTLFERALELIGQNEDEHISEWTIRNDIAGVYQLLGQTDEALRRMKENNADGLNDAAIGFLLASEEGKHEEALPYLSNALIKNVMELYRISIGYINAFDKRHDNQSILDMLHFAEGMLVMLRVPGKLSYLDKAIAMLYVQCAWSQAQMGDWEAARGYLEKAKALAEAFDAAPVYSYTDTRFFYGEKKMTAFDDFGSTVKEGILHAIDEMAQTEAGFVLKTMWEEMEQ